MAVPLVVCCVLWAMPGCNLYRSATRQLTQWISTPRARVLGVQVVEETAKGARVEVTLSVENPNAVDLPIDRAWYRLRVGGASHRYECVVHRTLPRGESQVLVLIAAVGKEEAGGLSGGLMGQAYRLDGEASYQPPGELRSLITDVRVPLPSFGFEARGTLVGASKPTGSARAEAARAEAQGAGSLAWNEGPVR